MRPFRSLHISTEQVLNISKSYICNRALVSRFPALFVFLTSRKKSAENRHLCGQMLINTSKNISDTSREPHIIQVKCYDHHYQVKM